MEQRARSRGALAAAGLALALALALAAAGAYLEAARRTDVAAMKSDIALLREQFTALEAAHARLVAQLTAMEKKAEEEKTAYYEDGEDGDYYDEDSYDDDEYPENDSTKAANRTRRAASESTSPYNLVIHSGPKQSSQPRERKVGAVVVIESDRRPLPRRPGPLHRPFSEPSYQEKSLLFNEESRSFDGKKISAESQLSTEDETLNSCSTVAAQYGGNTTQYRHAHHIHYDAGNHRLYHPDGKFKDWSPVNWSSHRFSIHNGEVRVQTPGLYYFYAQLFYADAHDTSGFRVLLNDSPVLQCTVTTLTPSSSISRLKRNSCHTSGLLLIKPNDRIILRELEGHRYTIFEPTKSFFGLFKVGCPPN